MKRLPLSIQQRSQRVVLRRHQLTLAPILFRRCAPGGILVLLACLVPSITLFVFAVIVILLPTLYTLCAWRVFTIQIGVDYIVVSGMSGLKVYTTLYTFGANGELTLSQSWFERQVNTGVLIIRHGDRTIRWAGLTPFSVLYSARKSK